MRKEGLARRFKLGPFGMSTGHPQHAMDGFLGAGRLTSAAPSQLPCAHVQDFQAVPHATPLALRP